MHFVLHSIFQHNILLLYENSLKIVQSLYEKGFCSYPRTPTSYLAENEKDKFKEIISSFQKLGKNIVFKDNKFIYGNLTKPSFKSECRIISGPELDIIYNVDKTKNVVKIGKSFLYNSYDVYLNINSFFANHFAILGNTGSGKSYSVSRLLQGIFYDAKRLPYNTNIFLFDAYGEYQRAFVNINQVNPNLNYKVYTTDLKSQDFELILTFLIILLTPSLHP